MTQGALLLACLVRSALLDGTGRCWESGSCPVDNSPLFDADHDLDAEGRDRQLKLREAGPALPSGSDDSGGVGIAVDVDVDVDVDADLFTGGRSVPGAYLTSPISRVTRNDSKKGSQAFTDITKSHAAGLITAGMVTGAAWADIICGNATLPGPLT